MKALGVAVAGAVLAAGLAGGSAFAARPHFPNNLAHDQRSATVQHCRNLAGQLADLARKAETAKTERQREAIQRHVERVRQQFLKQCT